MPQRCKCRSVQRRRSAPSLKKRWAVKTNLAGRLLLGANFLAYLPDDSSMANQLSAEELQKLKAKIKRAYDFFDKDGTGSVIQEYVSPCLHDALPVRVRCHPSRMYAPKPSVPH